MRLIPAVLLVLFSASPYSIAGNLHGEASCHDYAELQCHLAWDMTATPRAEYVLERFDLAQRSWQPYTSLYDAHRGITEDTLPGGSLVRVRGCRDYMRSESCVASVVVWVPYFAATTDELPDAVPLGSSGAQLGVQKNLSLYLANLDYNVGLLVNIIDAIHPDDVTPMRFPPVRIVDFKIVGGTMVSVDTSTSGLIEEMTQPMFLHNEVYGQWEGLVERIGRADD